MTSAYSKRELLEIKQDLIEEINELSIAELFVSDLNLLSGDDVNLVYLLPNGRTVKFLRDTDIYLGNQIEQQDSERCYGPVADDQFILVC